MKKIVTKFGGTSLADAEQFKKVRDILLADPARCIVVASAPGKRFADDIKVTDMLLACYRSAAAGEPYETQLAQIRARFADIIAELGIEFDLDSEIEKMREHLSIDPQIEYMASRGEYLNSRILAAYLGFSFVDPAWCVCFTENGELDLPMTKRAMRAALMPLDKAVLAGFYGADFNERIHTFSRGGSDISGSLAALAVDADLYENWTDVSGLLAADPRIVENPKGVEYLSFRELRTLSYMGASVLHTDAVLPASGAGIPINIRNTNRPDDHGTMIVKKLPKERERAAITGVAGKKGMTVIQVEKVMSSDGAGFSARMLDILGSRGIPFEHAQTGIDTVTVVIASNIFEAHRKELLDEIQDQLKPDFLGVKENLSMIVVVGEKGTDASDANVRVLHALAEAGVELTTINQGAGKLNLLIGVPEEKYEAAIRAIYAAID